MKNSELANAFTKLDALLDQIWSSETIEDREWLRSETNTIYPLVKGLAIFSEHKAHMFEWMSIMLEQRLKDYEVLCRDLLMDFNGMVINKKNVDGHENLIKEISKIPYKY